MLNCYLEIKTDPVMLFKAIQYNSSQFLQRITDVILLHQKSINSTYEYFAKIETNYLLIFQYGNDVFLF